MLLAKIWTKPHTCSNKLSAKPNITLTVARNKQQHFTAIPILKTPFNGETHRPTYWIFYRAVYCIISIIHHKSFLNKIYQKN